MMGFCHAQIQNTDKFVAGAVFSASEPEIASPAVLIHFFANRSSQHQHRLNSQLKRKREGVVVEYFNHGREEKIMPRLNKVSLVGHIGSVPEFHTFQNNGRSATISVATDDSYTDKTTGDRVARTEWHRIVVFGEKLVGTIESFNSENSLKGAQVFVEGKMRTRSWEDKDKVKRYTTEVVVTSYEGFQLLGKKATNGGTAEAPAAETAPPAEEVAQAA
jgi:single stranded DNA-binding protein